MQTGSLALVPSNNDSTGRRPRGRPAAETPFVWTTKTKLTAELHRRLDAEITRQIAAKPSQRPLPNRVSVIRDALDFFCQAVRSDPTLRAPTTPDGELPFVLQLRLTDQQHKQLDAEVTRQLAADPSQRPLPNRACVFRAALDFYLAHQEAKHGQPTLPFTSPSQGASDDS